MVIPPAWQGTACLPVPGEVCLGFFPFDEVPDAPGPVEHPVLVLARKKAEPFSLYVAYGTSKKLDQAKPWDLVLTKEEAAEVGLNLPTKFVLDRRRLLPYDETWFRRAVGRMTPRLDALPKAAMARLQQCRVTWELSHQESLIPGLPPKAELASPSGDAPVTGSDANARAAPVTPEPAV